jgi:hypothetical protein
MDDTEGGELAHSVTQHRYSFVFVRQEKYMCGRCVVTFFYYSAPSGKSLQLLPYTLIQNSESAAKP